jgi:L-threonylcarbamoyladenylate synthase
MATILPANSATITQVAAVLQQGEVVAIPTETVYGLAADATNPQAILKIYAAKQRPAFNPLIAHYPSLAAVAKDMHLPPLAQKLAETLWPAPLTLLLPPRPSCRVHELARAGMPLQAVRVPAHPIAQALLQAVDFPLVAPSANLSGLLSPVSAQHVAKSLGNRIDWILDGGDCSEGLESTIVDATGEYPIILRVGTITAAQISACCGVEAVLHLEADSETSPRSPGQLLRHYAPSCRLRLTVENPQPNEALLAFGAVIPQGFSKVLNLSETGNLTEAAAHLFQFLHQLEESGATSIAAMLVPEEGIGIAINDRLRRAAANGG